MAAEKSKKRTNSSSPIKAKSSRDSSKFDRLIGSKEQVMKGIAYKTSSQLTRPQLRRNKSGKAVSREKSRRGLTNNWPIAMKMAREELKLTGFVTLGKGSDGEKLLKRTREIFKELNEKKAKRETILTKIKSDMGKAQSKKQKKESTKV